MCDVTLTVNATLRSFKIKAHKCVLSAACDYFHVMFANQMVENLSNKVDLSESIPDVSAFRSLLQFFYTGSIEITLHNVVALLEMARMFFVSELTTHCVDFLTNIVTKSNCLIMTALASTYDLEALLKPAMNTLEFVFYSPCLKNQITKLTFEGMIWMLNQTWINQCPQFAYESICEWLAEVRLNDIQLIELISRVKELFGKLCGTDNIIDILKLWSDRESFKTLQRYDNEEMIVVDDRSNVLENYVSFKFFSPTKNQWYFYELRGTAKLSHSKIFPVSTAEILGTLKSGKILFRQNEALYYAYDIRNPENSYTVRAPHKGKNWKNAKFGFSNGEFICIQRGNSETRIWRFSEALSRNKKRWVLWRGGKICESMIKPTFVSGPNHVLIFSELWNDPAYTSNKHMYLRKHDDPSWVKELPYPSCRCKDRIAEHSPWNTAYVNSEISCHELCLTRKHSYESYKVLTQKFFRIYIVGKLVSSLQCEIYELDLETHTWTFHNEPKNIIEAAKTFQIFASNGVTFACHAFHSEKLPILRAITDNGVKSLPVIDLKQGEIIRCMTLPKYLIDLAEILPSCVSSEENCPILFKQKTYFSKNRVYPRSDDEEDEDEYDELDDDVSLLNYEEAYELFMF